MSTFGIFLDLLVVGLLVATIVYAVSLNKSIGRLRDGKAELATLLQSLSDAVTQADTAIKGMKTLVAQQDESLNKKIVTARALVDELQVINQTAHNLAGRIERATQAGRAMGNRPPTATPSPQPKAQATTKADPLESLLTDLAASVPFEQHSVKPQTAASRGGAERELLEAIELLRQGA